MALSDQPSVRLPHRVPFLLTVRIAEGEVCQGRGVAGEAAPEEGLSLLRWGEIRVIMMRRMRIQVFYFYAFVYECTFSLYFHYSRHLPLLKWIALIDSCYDLAMLCISLMIFH